jgi:uncharacterized membrane protein YqaE (UPF0057 family)
VQTRWLRVVIATLLPALALALAFPVMESFTTVYSRPRGFLAGRFFDICLLLVPAIVLAFWVRSMLLFSIGVAVFAIQSVGVAVQIAKTDDGQAGLAALNLPFYAGAVAVVLVGVDLALRRRRRRANAAEPDDLKSSGETTADR